MPLPTEQEALINEQIISVANALNLLQIQGTALYRAAFPGYPSNFSRDSFLYGMLSGDTEALRAQVQHSARHQGTTIDPLTGEEVGKIHHELPGVFINDQYSTYNACDTTALFLLALTSLYEAGDKSVLSRYSTNIDAGVAYIQSHVHDNLAQTPSERTEEGDAGPF